MSWANDRNRFRFFSAWLLEGFVLTACKKKNVMSGLHTKNAIDLTKTPFQLHDILSYAGSEITFIRQAPTGV